MPFIFLFTIFSKNILLKDANALIPLLPILDIADQNLEFWEKDGQFLEAWRQLDKGQDHRVQCRGQR